MMNHKDKRAARVAIFEDTMAWLRADPALKAAAEKAAANTILLEEDATGHPNVLQGRPCITVTKERTLECAARLHREDPARKIAVLNFASATHPGGGVVRGANAQEECLCRCTTLYPALKGAKAAPFYTLSHGSALHTDACLYTPGVLAVKTDTDLPERLPESEFFAFDVVSCSAPNLRPQPANAMNPGDIDPAHIADNDLLELHVRRWRQIMRAAAGRADVLVLGAFGCGAFRNPPALVADAFQELLRRDPLLATVFKEIVFAVYCPPQDDTNYRVFRDSFAEKG